MELFNTDLLANCIKDAVRNELKTFFKEKKFHSNNEPKEVKLLTKKEMAEQLDISLVTLTDWMKKGLPYKRLHSRIYFDRDEVFSYMQEIQNSRK